MTDRIQSVDIKASPEKSYSLVADVAAWPSYMPAVRNAFRVSGDDHVEVVEIEAEAGDTTYKWRSRRQLNSAARTITFERIDPRPPFLSMRGKWTFLRIPDGTRVVLEHQYELVNPDTDGQRTEAIIASNVEKDFAGLKKRSELEAEHERPVAIVTGGSRGIGFAIASALAASGQDVILGARDQVALERAVDRLSAVNTLVDVTGRELDVTEDRSVKSFFDWARDRERRPNILINNAGIGGGGRTTALDDSLWFEIINTNVHGVYRCTLAFLRALEAEPRSWARIINVASTGGKQGVAFGAAYSASKHAVVGFTKALGLEYAKSKITVNAVCPGFVETDLAVGARQRYGEVYGLRPAEVKARIEGRVPIGRYIEPEEVAEAVLYFAGRGADGVTAQTLNVCGGLGNY